MNLTTPRRPRDDSATCCISCDGYECEVEHHFDLKKSTNIFKIPRDSGVFEDSAGDRPHSTTFPWLNFQCNAGGSS